MLDELTKQLEDISKAYPSLLEEAKEISKHLDNGNDKGFVNEKGSSMVLKESGEIALASSLYSQYRIEPNGYSNEITIQSTVTTNRRQINADEIVINKHKLNPALYELSDMREYSINPDTAIGNLTMFATVLVKAWEPTLKKWVLIRRLARMPMFSPTLNLPNVPDQMSLNVNISDEILKLSRGGETDE